MKSKIMWVQIIFLLAIIEANSTDKSLPQDLLDEAYGLLEASVPIQNTRKPQLSQKDIFLEKNIPIKILQFEITQEASSLNKIQDNQISAVALDQKTEIETANNQINDLLLEGEIINSDHFESHKEQQIIQPISENKVDEIANDLQFGSLQLNQNQSEIYLDEMINKEQNSIQTDDDIVQIFQQTDNEQTEKLQDFMDILGETRQTEALILQKIDNNESGDNQSKDQQPVQTYNQIYASEQNFQESFVSENQQELINPVDQNIFQAQDKLEREEIENFIDQQGNHNEEIFDEQQNSQSKIQVNENRNEVSIKQIKKEEQNQYLTESQQEVGYLESLSVLDEDQDIDLNQITKEHIENDEKIGFQQQTSQKLQSDIPNLEDSLITPISDEIIFDISSQLNESFGVGGFDLKDQKQENSKEISSQTIVMLNDQIDILNLSESQAIDKPLKALVEDQITQAEQVLNKLKNNQLDIISSTQLHETDDKMIEQVLEQQIQYSKSILNKLQGTQLVLTDNDLNSDSKIQQRQQLQEQQNDAQEIDYAQIVYYDTIPKQSPLKEKYELETPKDLNKPAESNKKNELRMEQELKEILRQKPSSNSKENEHKQNENQLPITKFETNNLYNNRNDFNFLVDEQLNIAKMASNKFADEGEQKQVYQGVHVNRFDYNQDSNRLENQLIDSPSIDTQNRLDYVENFGQLNNNLIDQIIREKKFEEEILKPGKTFAKDPFSQHENNKVGPIVVAKGKTKLNYPIGEIENIQPKFESEAFLPTQSINQPILESHDESLESVINIRASEQKGKHFSFKYNTELTKNYLVKDFESKIEKQSNRNLRTAYKQIEFTEINRDGFVSDGNIQEIVKKFLEEQDQQKDEQVVEQVVAEEEEKPQDLNIDADDDPFLDDSIEIIKNYSQLKQIQNSKN